ncbi:hypothetical protein NEIMUCOT_04917 [Neisseria mucosa ATCC 25996]|uniref:Uncharacterized protein n=1 Tax=Neisseria mucosa (strain ATCC 25996 / DSM 4631 / NCTC 10774 / M26) TaxID=546266 RepID=D2ZWC4_NEIM2|nr:hypothetical protein NEIMUCOT_04917 [Neisseria mucosa ATCC 25996]
MGSTHDINARITAKFKLWTTGSRTRPTLLINFQAPINLIKRSSENRNFSFQTTFLLINLLILKKNKFPLVG